MTTLSVTASYTDKTGNTASKVVTATISSSARFPGDPGVGKIRIGLNDASSYENVQAQMPHPFTLRRIYNGTNWTLPSTKLQAAVAAGKIPIQSWKLGSYTLDTVPDSAIDANLNTLKALGKPVWCTPLFHEPENDFTTAAACSSFRTLSRRIVLRARALGITNIAWVDTLYMCDYSFSTGSGRDWRWWNGNWKGTTTGTSADWYSGSDDIYDLDGFDVYDPRIGSWSWASLQAQHSRATFLMASQGYALHPSVIGEFGLKSDTNTGDMAKGPTEMQNAYDYAVANDVVGLAFWNNGGNSFCHGEVPVSDPGCYREQKLASLVGDPRTVYTV